MKARSLLAAFVVALSLPAAASATTVGTVVEPSSASPLNCSSLPPTEILVQTAGDTIATPGAITSWSVNATGDAAGGIETMYVLAPAGTGFTVVGSATGTLPSPIPAGGIVTFNLATPIVTSMGDTFGMSVSGTSPINCAWTGLSVVSDTVNLYVGAGGGVGSAVTPASPGSSPIPGFILDLAATLSTTQDAAVTTTAGPGNAIVGNEALLSSTVTNNGPTTTPITFTDAVPTGLTVDAAATDGGACTTGGQLVTCTITSLAVGTSAPVEIVVTPTAAQNYQNSVSVTDATNGITDPNLANNAATATLTAGAAAITSALSTRECVTTSVKGLGEKVVKRLLPSLGCKVGKIKKATSKSVAKGDVISITPGSGSHPAGTAVTITVSSGKPKKKHKS
jgi:hypothetical protein